MSRIVFSASARLDRREITSFTTDRFGIQQARRLRKEFQDVLERLAAAPLAGRLREELDPPGYTFRYALVMRRFIIVYEPTGEEGEEGIRVARILHGARDLAEDLQDDPGDR